jgi:hypothetical protein
MKPKNKNLSVTEPLRRGPSRTEAIKQKNSKYSPGYWRLLPSNMYVKIQQTEKFGKCCSYLKIAKNSKSVVIICS